jgi:hypothetical protein
MNIPMKLKKGTAVLGCCWCLSVYAFAQKEAPESMLQEHTEQKGYELKTLQKVSVSGYIQTQWQYGEKDAALKVGTPNENPEEAFSRFGIRRGRIKLVCENDFASGVFQLDMTEKGAGIKDAYLLVKAPRFAACALKAGVFYRPFGHEISYSSSRRESPERSTVFQTLFPEERDLGALLLLQPAKTSAWNFLKLEVGLFAGNGVKQETDSRKDFIGHLSADKIIGSGMRIGGGVSCYNGSVYQGTENVYRMEGKKFVLNSDAVNRGKFAKREYIGLDAQLSLLSGLGMTQLRAEYLFGEQPGTISGSQSPNASVLPSSDTFIRNFRGGYAILVHDFGTLPLSSVLKYDFYDPNTKVSGNETGLNETTASDNARRSFGLGLLWRVNSNIRLQGFYEINKNEKSENLAGYEKDRKDNVFTLRAQYSF